MSGFGADQGTGATVAAVLRSTGEPGKARPIRGGGRTANRIRRREPGKIVAVWSSISQRAWAACVRCGGGAVFAFEPAEIGADHTDLVVEGAALRMVDGAGRLLRIDLVINERIEQKLFSHVLEEVLLSPALEHAVGNLDVAQVPS